MKEKHFCGSGVLLLQNNNFIFVFDKFGKKYSEPGGNTNRHHHHSVFQTGRDELCEETALYICIPYLKTMKRLPYFDMRHETDENDNSCFYRVFILRIPDNITVSKQKYMHNMTMLDSHPDLFPGSCYRETNNMKFMSIDKVRSILDDTGEMKKLFYKRTRNVLKHFFIHFKNSLKEKHKIKAGFGKVKWKNGVYLHHIILI